MANYHFERLDGHMVQIAFVVPTLRPAIEEWILQRGVGPWFIADHFRGLEMRYRAAPTTVDVSIAMAFTGSMCVELIEQHDDQPSVYRELISTSGCGFHHCGIGTRNFDSLLAKYTALGHEAVFTDREPGGARIAYLTSADSLSGMTELIEFTEGVEAMFERFRRAAVNWDGRDPVRPFM